MTITNINLINSENLFLIILGFIWIIGAVLQDLRRREVDNIWNFSLIGFALAYRASVSVYTLNYWFFINGLIGFLFLLVLGNLFYYMKLFAGGDAKLLIALGPVLPLSYDWIVNLKIYGSFIILFLAAGSFYVLLWSIVLAIKNWKKFIKEYKKQFKNYKNLFLLGSGFFVFWIVLGIVFKSTTVGLISLIVILFPVLFVFAKSIEETCMIRELNPSKITEGDWLYKDIIINGKKIKSSWDGLSKSQLSFIRKSNSKVLIKEGIPFTPGFLFGFILLVFLMVRYGWIF